MPFCTECGPPLAVLERINRTLPCSKCGTEPPPAESTTPSSIISVEKLPAWAIGKMVSRSCDAFHPSLPYTAKANYRNINNIYVSPDVTGETIVLEGESMVHCIRWHRTLPHVLAATCDKVGMVTVWNVRTRTCVMNAYEEDYCGTRRKWHNMYGERNCIEWHPADPNILATGGKQGVKVWNIATGECIATLKMHQSVRSVYWSPADPTILAVDHTPDDVMRKCSDPVHQGRYDRPRSQFIDSQHNDECTSTGAYTLWTIPAVLGPLWSIELHCSTPLSFVPPPARTFVRFVMFVGEASGNSNPTPRTPLNLLEDTGDRPSCVCRGRLAHQCLLSRRQL